MTRRLRADPPAIEAVSDPVSTFPSIAKFADQARVLETLMTAACEVAVMLTGHACWSGSID
jgi:hypothetical protein